MLDHYSSVPTSLLVPLPPHQDQEAFEISLLPLGGDAVIADPDKVVVLIGVNDDANGVLLFEAFGQDPAGVCVCWGGRYQPTLEMPLGHMAKACTITLYKRMLKENGFTSYDLQS